MASQSRELVRDAFAGLLTTALVSTDKAEAVYNYQVGDFLQLLKVVTVTSGGIERQQETFGPCWQTTIYLNVHVFVLYAMTDGTWTEAMAEDALDTIEAAIADVVLENSNYDADDVRWHQISYAERTMADGVEIGGLEYRREIIPLKVEITENG